VVGAWIQAARPLAQGNLAPYMLLGQALAYALTGVFDPWMLVAGLGFTVLDQLVIVFANDVADVEGDVLNETYTPFSGGSRVLVEERLSPGALRWAAWAAAGALALLCLVLAWRFSRPLMPAFAAVALLLLLVYSFPPFRGSYRGYGEGLQAVGVGLVLPMVGFYLQAGTLLALPAPALVPTYLLGFAGNVITGLPDTPADRAVGKATWAVRRGQRTARRDAVVLTALAIAAVPFVTPALPAPWLAAIVAVPALLLASALPLVPTADADNRRACFSFVLRSAGAGGVLVLLWAAALAWG